MRFGSFQCHSVLTGFCALDGGAMFGSVPRAVWSRTFAPDAEHRIRLALRALLVVTEVDGATRRILIDTGIGTKFSEEHAARFGVEHSEHTLDGALAALGFARADITDVILTHLHFDHAGGVSERLPVGQTILSDNPAGGLALTFPHARHYLQRANLDNATAPTSRERASYLAENIEPLVRSERLTLLDGPTELWPGLSVEVSNGHTRGMQIVRVTGDDGSCLVYPADLIPTAAHLRGPFVMGYDRFAELVVEEKEALLESVAAVDGVVLFEHDPRFAAARIRQGDRHFEVAETVDL